MGFLDHIHACNQRDTAHFQPFYVADKRVGWVAKDKLHHLAETSDLFRITADRVDLTDSLADSDARTAALEPVCQALTDRGLTPTRREEQFPVGTRFGEELLRIERACVPFFGIRAYGIHVNGFVRDGDQLLLWIPRRAENLVIEPGKLDNMIAGGQPAGLGLMENLIKEADEEASIPEALASKAKPIGTVTYCYDEHYGLKPDTLFNYDLEMPADLIPVNRDGEVEDFRLIPARDVFEIVDTTEAFKLNCNLVLIDFFVRHGLLSPDRPDYVDITRGLHQ